MWEILVIEFILCCIFALLLYKKYGSFTKRPWYVTFLTLAGWILCFYIVFLVPNDVSQAAQCDVAICPNVTVDDSSIFGSIINNYDDNTDPEKCTGVVIVPFSALVWLWRAVYWITLLATWGVYPIVQTYSMTGEFSFGEKMRTSIKSNLLLYAIMAIVLAIVGVIYIIESGIKWSSVPAVAMSAANAYGLFMIIAMLGHGLVNVPRNIWNHANLQLSLKKLHFEVADYDTKLHESQNRLLKTLKKIRKASEITSESDSYRKYIDIIISKCPKEYEGVLFGEGNIEISYRSLASLHEKLMKEDHAVQLYQSLLKNTLEHAFFMEDIVHSIGNPDFRIKWSFKPPKTGSFGRIIEVSEYLWYCYIRKRVLQAFSILLIGLSIIVVWSELLFFICKIDLSIFSLYIRAIRLFPPFLLQLAIFLPVVYIAWCAYSSLFRLRLFNYYHIVPHSKSDSNSLLFSAAYLCRLTAPLAYNFMEMSHYENTAFVSVIGELDISGLGEAFQNLFPILLLPFLLITLFNVYSKILNLLRIKRFQFDDDFNDQHIEDGKDIIADERERRKYKADREESGNRKSDIERNSNLRVSSNSPLRNSNSNLNNNNIIIEDLPISNEPSFIDKFKNFFSSPSLSKSSSVSSSRNMNNNNVDSSSVPLFGNKNSRKNDNLPSFLDEDDSSIDPWGDDNPFKL